MKNKITHTGLKEFEKERKSLSKDIDLLLGIVNSETGHLGDVVGGLKTMMSSINIKAGKLSNEFKKQKSLQGSTDSFKF